MIFYTKEMLWYIPEMNAPNDSELSSLVDLDLLEVVLSVSDTSEWFRFLLEFVFGVLMDGITVACSLIGVQLSRSWSRGANPIGGKFGKVNGTSGKLSSLLLFARFSMVNAILCGFWFTNIFVWIFYLLVCSFSKNNFECEWFMPNRVYIPGVINLITFINTV